MIKNIIFEYNHHKYQTDFTKPIDISMPLKAGLETANCYYAAPVQYETIVVGDFVGDVSLGGSCNYQRVSFTPHGNGTHTECYGHVVANNTENNTKHSTTINENLKEFMFFALVISVPIHKIENGDEVITLQNLQNELQSLSHNLKQVEALIIRTLANDDSKLTRHYSGTNPPYLEPKIGQYLKEIGIKHLLLDLPSVDKEWDNGVLQNHRDFWNLPPNLPPKRETTNLIDVSKVRTDCTITELIFVPNTVEDGHYLLNLQIASFESDASPSKPILYALKSMD